MNRAVVSPRRCDYWQRRGMKHDTLAIIRPVPPLDQPDIHGMFFLLGCLADFAELESAVEKSHVAMTPQSVRAGQGNLNSPSADNWKLGEEDEYAPLIRCNSRKKAKE